MSFFHSEERPSDKVLIDPSKDSVVITPVGKYATVKLRYNALRGAR